LLLFVLLFFQAIANSENPMHSHGLRYPSKPVQKPVQGEQPFEERHNLLLTGQNSPDSVREEHSTDSVKQGQTRRIPISSLVNEILALILAAGSLAGLVAILRVYNNSGIYIAHALRNLI